MSIRTTVVGSYPCSGLGPEEALARAVRDQAEAGIHLLSDGQCRGDMIGSFLSHMPGCVRRHDGRWAVTRRPEAPAAPMTVPDWERAVRLAGGRPVKGILTGPTTLACAVQVEPGAPYSGPGDPALVRDFAAVLAGEAEALVAAGARVIQLDEPFFSLGTDLAVGLNAVARVLTGVPEPWLHCCGDVRQAWEALRHASVAVLQIEGSRTDRLPPFGRGMGPALGLGVIDSSGDAVEAEEEVLSRIEAARAAGARSIEWLSPDCGLRLRSPEAARRKLTVLARVAATL